MVMDDYSIEEIFPPEDRRKFVDAYLRNRYRINSNLEADNKYSGRFTLGFFSISREKKLVKKTKERIKNGLGLGKSTKEELDFLRSYYKDWRRRLTRWDNALNRWRDFQEDWVDDWKQLLHSSDPNNDAGMEDNEAVDLLTLLEKDYENYLRKYFEHLTGDKTINDVLDYLRDEIDPRMRLLPPEETEPNVKTSENVGKIRNIPWRGRGSGSTKGLKDLVYLLQRLFDLEYICYPDSKLNKLLYSIFREESLELFNKDSIKAMKTKLRKHPSQKGKAASLILAGIETDQHTKLLDYCQRRGQSVDEALHIAIEALLETEAKGLEQLEDEAMKRSMYGDNQLE